LKVFLDTPIFETEPESLELRRAIGVTDGPLCRQIMVSVPMAGKSYGISPSVSDKYNLVKTSYSQLNQQKYSLLACSTYRQ
jgi:hypothetical protein